jgi:hypothetical protein
VRTIRAVTLAEVVEALSKERDLQSGSAPWTVRFLAHANEQFAGRWSEIELSGDEALEVVLPAHAGEPCRGDRRPLLESGGGTVREAALILSRIQTEYARDNASCWGRISQAAQDSISPVILTRAPLTLPDYAEVRATAGSLVHLDGFHRLVGWALAGRLSCEISLRAFVAGLR